jgi:hypothetical protein
MELLISSKKKKSGVDAQGSFNRVRLIEVKAKKMPLRYCEGSSLAKQLGALRTLRFGAILWTIGNWIC